MSGIDPCRGHANARTRLPDPNPHLPEGIQDAARLSTDLQTRHAGTSQCRREGPIHARPAWDSSTSAILQGHAGSGASPSSADQEKQTMTGPHDANADI